MKLKLKRKKEVVEIIDIDFPYYYKCDFMMDESDCIAYGKIEKNKHTQITITEYYANLERRYELEIEKMQAESLECYIKDKYKSNKYEFETAKLAMQNAITFT